VFKNKLLTCILVVAFIAAGVAGFGVNSIVSASDVSRDSEDKGTAEAPGDKLAGSVAVYERSMYSLVNNEVKVIDPENELITPFSQNNRMMVPLRFIAESFGANVAWDQATQTVSIVSNEKTIKIRLYDNKMTVNGKTEEIDVPAMATGNRTFVPLRALGEALDKSVFYDRGLVVISDKKKTFDKDKDKSLIDEIIGEINILPKVGTSQKLVELLKEATGSGIAYYRGRMAVAVDAGNAAAEVSNDLASAGFQSKDKPGSSAATTDSASKSLKVTEAEESSYSRTNIQVEGVDEGDIVKTDGRYIYQASNNKILIYKAYPASEMALVGTVSFTDGKFAPAELYIKDNQLVVIGTEWSEPAYDLPVKIGGVAPDIAVAKSIYPYYGNSSVKALIYDVTDRSKPVKTREASLQGNYVSSRLIGDDLYFISNNYIYYWNNQPVPLNPTYYDSVVGPEKISVPFEDIEYMPPVVNQSYLMIAGLSLDEPEKQLNVGTWLGAGEEVYVSQDNLYVTIHQGYAGIRPMIMTEGGFMPPEQLDASMIYKFSLKDGKATYQARGQVTGRLLNQFSMDEYDNYFRVATTVERSWWGGEDSSGNNVYILDSGLNITGKLEGLAKGENIYSVRFMGGKAYVVTFKTVDPLFVIDVSDPFKPAVLGALKIPGYSDYLHPYDENHIIGFGKDTIVVPQKDRWGNQTGETAYYLGMKVALFDVSDVSNPVVKSEIKIGDRGTESELLYDHKALLFDKEKQILAFPVNEAKVDGPVIDPYTGYPQYGRIIFNGAYVYNINLEEGFVLKGKVSHATSEDYLQSGYYNIDYNKQIRRMLYINDVLYGVSNNYLSAHDMNDLREIGKVKGN